MPMMPCGGRCGRHSLTRALSCLRPLAGEYGCGRRSTAGEGRREADRAEGTESRENRLGSGGTNGRGPWPPMRKPAGGRAVGGGRRVAQLLAGGRRRAAGHAAGYVQAMQSRRGWRRGEGDAQVREDSRAPRFVLARSMPEPTRNRTDDIAYCPDPTVSGLTGDVGPILSPRNNPGFDIKRLLIGSCFLFFYAVGS